MITTLVKEFVKTGKATRDEVVAKLFEIFGNEELVDKYYVYQHLADNWDMIENDLITIRENGIKVCRQTEPNMVLKKDSKTKKTNEVQDGWKGTIMPFDMIEKVFFGKDFETMRELEAQADGFASEYADTFDNLDEDVKKEVSKEEGTTFDSKMLKDKIKDIATPDDVLEILKSAVKTKEQENALRKKIKIISSSLAVKAKEKVESLTDAEITDLLVYKWISPVINGVNSTCDSSIDTFIKGLISLKNKYSNNLSEINAEIHKANAELFALMDELVGSETDMLAIQMLKDALK